MIQELSTLQNFFDQFNILAKENPIIAGAISLWGLGVITYLFRNVPNRIIAFLVKHFTTTVYISSTHEIYHLFMKWLDKQGISDKLRKIKYTNGRWGYSDTVTKGVGYGEHVIWYKHHPIQIQVTKEENKGDSIIDTLVLTKLGRSHNFFNILFADILKSDPEEIKTHIYSFNGKSWEFSKSQPLRSFDTVYIDSAAKQKLLEGLNKFKSKEKWYLENGIPYRMGILLYGHPGTDKTSVIKAIAAHLNLKLCILPVRYLFTLENAVSGLPDNSILVIEDIDSSSMVKARNNLLKSKNAITAKPQLPDSVVSPKDTVKEGCITAPSFSSAPEEISEEQFEYLTSLLNTSDGGLSTILNAIDGVSDSFGRVLIMTTNRPAVLDAALTRPGRIDVSIEIGFVSPEIFTQFMKRFFPEDVLPQNFNVISSTTVAQLQQCLLEEMSFSDICAKFILEVFDV